MTRMIRYKQQPTAPINSALSSINVTPLKILQYNCNGLRDKLQEILHFMDSNNILIAALQETKLTARSHISTPNHAIVRLDRDRGGIGGGIAFLIHKSIMYSSITLPDPILALAPIEQQAISISSGTTTTTLVNVYIPPVTSCPSGSTANIDHLLDQNFGVIMGDFNGHHPLWHSDLAAHARGQL